MSSVPNITPGYPSNRPQVVGRIGQEKPASAEHAAAQAPADKSDTVELSSEAIAAATSPADTARAERLALIKSRIQAGTYDEDAKLTFVADRLARLFGNG
ncbi:MAG TPA: flagellar biosynthesis anti-sigma factor FlgM [Phycisphaerales bacterium]|nr:flagellar biosynthesis anti-sigma factor FlgM [Phycisphaerales bacterium]